MLTEILPRLPANDATYGTTYQERTKSISARMKKEDVYKRQKHSRPDAEKLFQPDISGRIRLEGLPDARPVGARQPDAETPARLPVGILPEISGDVYKRQGKEEAEKGADGSKTAYGKRIGDFSD